MDELIKVKVAEEQSRMLLQVRDEAVENAITAVKTRIKDQLEAEAVKDEAATSEADDTMAENEKDGEGKFNIN